MTPGIDSEFADSAPHADDTATHATPLDDRRTAVREAIRGATAAVAREHIRLAALLFEVAERKYWRCWGFKSFRAFVDRECGFGMRKAQLMLEFHRKFVIDLRIPHADLEAIGWSKLALAAGSISQDNKEQILAALKAMSHRELKDYLRAGRLDSSISTCVPVLLTDVLGDGELYEWAVAEHCATKPWSLAPPDPSQFFVDAEVWEQLCFALHSGMNVLLTGPSGSGKSELCALAARAANRPMEMFNFGAMTEPRTSLIGNIQFSPTTGTHFVKSRFVNAVERPDTILLLDELSRAGRDAFNILLPLLDGQKYLSLDEDDQASTAVRARGVCFFATANIGVEYTGADTLDAALKDRFPIQIAVGFPPPDREAALLVNRCDGLCESDADRLVKLASRQRQLAKEGDFIGTVSTRALLAAGRQVAGGISMANAVRFCVLNHFSDVEGEASERTRLAQVFQKDELLE